MIYPMKVRADEGDEVLDSVAEAEIDESPEKRRVKQVSKGIAITERVRPRGNPAE
jgi:hypothetical protein